MFTITQGKGISIQFSNGYDVSIQFGWGNYCSHRNTEPAHNASYEEHQAKLGAEGSISAEVAIFDRYGRCIEEAEGWCSPERVTEILTEVAAMPPCKEVSNG